MAHKLKEEMVGGSDGTKKILKKITDRLVKTIFVFLFMCGGQGDTHFCYILLITISKEIYLLYGQNV